MAGVSLLALLDDIATLLDDIAVLSKVAAKKTAGVLADDLAVNAEQVSGVRAERELPVVWAVAKGSLLNKLILVPAALLMSLYAPWLITPVLMLGGTYLCYEGAEKLHEWIVHKPKESSAQERLDHLSLPKIDLLTLEKDKIKGAIRTDFVLSAEIVVIILGSVADTSFTNQVIVVAGLALFFTIAVYGLVAAIVKMDDVGLYLVEAEKAGRNGRVSGLLGRGLVNAAGPLMHALSVLGTIAMFLVGGGILVHGWPWLHHWFEPLTSLWAMLANSGVGVITGLAVLGLITLITRLRALG
ncbi:MAG: putative DNA repair protein MutK [Candidatus Paceibacteria bacterium]|jgi:predicted DNA repair protein MutK|tara:strand:- start:9874 stop:10770 length:897 start_codon:yes stop_codon:yes gene_type:complete